MSEHTLTEHERRLLEDCPREARYFGTVEQDEREAEIERRIGVLVNNPNLVAEFERYESKYDRVYLDAAGFPWMSSFLIGGKPTIPASRIRAAIDAKRAAEKEPTYGQPPPGVRQAWREAQEDHFRDAAEKVEGPYNILVCGNGVKLMNDGTCWADYWVNIHAKRYPTIEAAKEAAEAEAARLNAKWREEQEAKEREAEKQRRIEAFVAFYKSHPLDWFWSAESDRQYWIAPNGGSYSHQKLFGDEPRRMLIPRAELEAALRAAGVEEPVTISDELRARLEKRWDVAISVFMPCVDETLVDEDGNSNPNNGHRFTRQQARAFLAEKGVKVDE